MGNIATNKNVSLIMIDYPQQARLKMFTKSDIVELQDRPDLLEVLSLADYVHKPERMVLLQIEAYDWNCPLHITPRYTVEEIEEVLLSQRKYIQRLENKIKEVKNRK